MKNPDEAARTGRDLIAAGASLGWTATMLPDVPREARLVLGVSVLFWALLARSAPRARADRPAAYVPEG